MKLSPTFYKSVNTRNNKVSTSFREAKKVLAQMNLTLERKKKHWNCNVTQKTNYPKINLKSKTLKYFGVMGNNIKSKINYLVCKKNLLQLGLGVCVWRHKQRREGKIGIVYPRNQGFLVSLFFAFFLHLNQTKQ